MENVTKGLENIYEAMLQWGHGDDAVEPPPVYIKTHRVQSLLQWGHGDDAVENAAGRFLREHDGDASMGPRR